MTQSERRRYLIRALLDEQPQYRNMDIPEGETEQKRLLRALFNIRVPMDIGADFLQMQDEYLSVCREEKGIVRTTDCEELQQGIRLWQGDITRLAADAIVNAANSGMTGCYQPNHNCIDNCIHTYAGIQLRLACADMMKRQGHEEETGKAKITPAYNLPSKYILHTVGPIVRGNLNEIHCEQLASCYRSCMELAEKHHCSSIAFCCISTGVYGFPNVEAAEIAVKTVQDYRERSGKEMEVVFNVFKDEDYEIYRRLLE